MLLKVKLDSRAKGSWFGVGPKAIWSCALKVRKDTVASGWTNVRVLVGGEGALEGPGGLPIACLLS